MRKINTVEPIRNPKKIMAIKNLLKVKNNPRDYLLFTLGVNFALRISDLLSLKVNDVLDKNGEVVNHIFIREKKTKKEKKIRINKVSKEALNFYFSKMPAIDPEQYLFTSNSGRQLDRIRVWQMIKNWTEQVESKGRYGTHTLRKTWGYMARKQGIAIEVIQQKLGHRSASVTRRYIGITQDEVNKVEDKVCI